MKIHWLRQNTSSKLVIFFSGFACDENIFKDYSFDGYDILLVCDYASLDIDLPGYVFDYKEVFHAAWSFGVWAADYVKDRLPVAKMRVALCGSPYPVDDMFGIPSAIFNGTLENFDEKNMGKFYARIFGPKEFSKFKHILNCATASEKKRELASLGAAFKTFEPSPKNWTRAIAANKDKIFPLENLKRVWGDKLEIISGEHFPSQIFEEGFSRIFADTQSVVKSFGRAFDDYDRGAEVQKKIAERLALLVFEYADLGKTQKILEVGAGTGFLSKALVPKLGKCEWHLNDLSADSIAYLDKIFGKSINFIAGDAQLQELPSGMDLIVSASCFQWISNVGAFLKKLGASCSEGAVLAFSTFLPENLKEIKFVGGKGLEYPDYSLLKAFLEEGGFEVLYSETDSIALEFESPSCVLRHLRATGVSGAFSEFWTPQKLKRFTKSYRDSFSVEGSRVSLTYAPVYFVAKYAAKTKA